MVDIDEDVVAFCKEHLNENAAAFADKRLELIIDDAKASSPCGRARSLGHLPRPQHKALVCLPLCRIGGAGERGQV